MVLGVISLVVSIVSLCFSVYVFFKNKLYSNISVESQLFENINSAISAYYNKHSDYSVFNGGTDELSTSIKKEFYSSIDGVLSAYNFACIQYKIASINENRFAELYLSDIKSFIEKDNFKEMLNTPGKYGCLKDFIKSH